MTTEILRYKRITWTNITRATRDDVDMLREEYPHFHPLDLEDLLSRIERPKLDEYDGYLFTVMHFPIWDASQRISRASELDMFVGPSYIVTVHDGVLQPLLTLFQTCQGEEAARQRYMNQGASLLFYTIVDQLVDSIFPQLYAVDRKIRDVEEEIFIEDTRNIIQALAFLRRDNIALRHIVRPQLEIIDNLEKTERAFLREDLDVYFGDVRDHLYKAADLIHDHNEVIEGLFDTANIIANSRTNEIVRVLTVISVLMMPLTLISGIYGMNVLLPGQEHPAAFLGVVVAMLMTGFSMLAYFRHRGWL